MRYILLMILVLPRTVSAAPDVLNPVPLFRTVQPFHPGHTTDSVLAAEVFFEPLPQFETETSVFVRQGIIWNTEAGVRFTLTGDGVPFALSARQYTLTVPGPLVRGDSIEVEFRITPHEVGVLDLYVTMTENTQVDSLHPHPNIFGGGHANILLAPDGTTKALGTPAVDSDRATRFGPIPSIWVGGRTFRMAARAPDPAPFGMAEQWDSLVEAMFPFGLEVSVQPVTGTPHKLQVTSQVTCYHRFERGIGYLVSIDSGMTLTEMSDSHVGPVRPGEVYAFSCALSWGAPGVHTLGLRFSTANEYMNGPEGTFGEGRDGLLSTGLTLCRCG